MRSRPSTRCTKPPPRRKTSPAPGAACAHIPRALEALYPLAGVLPAGEPLLSRPRASRRRRPAEAPDAAAAATRHRRPVPRRRSRRARRRMDVRPRNLRSRPTAPRRLRAARRLRPGPQPSCGAGSPPAAHAARSSLRRPRSARHGRSRAPTATRRTSPASWPSSADKWTVDPARILLTGMSDGGTFSYTSGLVAGSPFTHLAPVAAAFHPMLAAMADADRMTGLPIHIIHGAARLDVPRRHGAARPNDISPAPAQPSPIAKSTTSATATAQI